jgi:hypothetical protein
VVGTGRTVRATEEAAVGTGLIINENRRQYCKINRNITNLEQYINGRKNI